MTTTRTEPDAMPWSAGTELYGAAPLYEGATILELKRLSDRRAEGGGVAYLLLRASPPAGKLIKIVAVARSDEHVFNLSGGRANKAGKPVSAPDGYALNPESQPHSAVIAGESVSLVVYADEPDELTSVEVVDLEPAPGDRA